MEEESQDHHNLLTVSRRKSEVLKVADAKSLAE
jgi:hypothetical protein